MFDKDMLSAMVDELEKIAINLGAYSAPVTGGKPLEETWPHSANKAAGIRELGSREARVGLSREGSQRLLSMGRKAAAPRVGPGRTFLRILGKVR